MTGLTIRDVPARPFTLKIISTFEPKVNPRSQSGITVCEGYYVNSVSVLCTVLCCAVLSLPLVVWESAPYGFCVQTC